MSNAVNDWQVILVLGRDVRSWARKKRVLRRTVGWSNPTPALVFLAALARFLFALALVRVS
jgi:hypothetical protein